MKTSAAIAIARPSEASRRAVAPRRATRLRSLVRKKPATPIASLNRPGNEKSEKTAEKKASGKTDGSGYLGMYFRDMQTLHVLRPEEEFTSAREIETLEIMLWEQILAFVPALPIVLEAVEAHVPGVA